MRRRWILFVLIGAVGGAIGLYLWLWGGLDAEDVLVSRGSSVAEAPRDGALFHFGNAYLDGRSAWLGDLFARRRDALHTLAIPDEPRIECLVHRAPFTRGPWVEALGEELARHRKETESQCVESSVVFFLKDVAARDVLAYMMTSEFLERIPGEGTLEQESFFVRPWDGGALSEPVPALARHQWITRVRWSCALAKPTAAVYLNAAFRDGDVLGAVYDAWRNIGDSSHASIRLDAGQYAVLPRDGGVLVEVKTFYSGQTIPAGLGGFAASMTKGFYRKLVDLVNSEVRTWKAPPEVIARLKELGHY